VYLEPRFENYAFLAAGNLEKNLKKFAVTTKKAFIRVKNDENIFDFF